MKTEEAALSQDVTLALERCEVVKNGKIHRFLQLRAYSGSVYRKGSKEVRFRIEEEIEGNIKEHFLPGVAKGGAGKP